MLFAKNLGQSCDELIDAVNKRDEERFHKALERMTGAAQEAGPAEMQDAVLKLTPVLAEISYGMGADLVKVAGSMAGRVTDAMVLLPTLVRRAADAMEQAARFASAYGEAFGDLPEAEDQSLIEPTIERFVGAAPRLGMPEREAYGLVEAWFAGGEWVQPVLYLSQRKDIRAALPERERLTAAIDAVREHIGTAHWLYGLLLVLDDAPLTVLHRPTGRGYRVTISGIGDNFQLHTLLAARLIGDESQGLLPGEPPSAAAIAAASDGEDMTPAGGITGQFNLVDAYGEWIWNEGRPADIPLLEGERVVALDPPPVRQSLERRSGLSADAPEPDRGPHPARRQGRTLAQHGQTLAALAAEPRSALGVCPSWRPVRRQTSQVRLLGRQVPVAVPSSSGLMKGRTWASAS